MSTNREQRWIGFDFGLGWIGVAVGQRITTTATALDSLRVRDGIPNWDDIDRLIKDWQPAGFVVGMPYNMDGSENEILVRANKFRKRLHGRYGLPAIGVDERLSSREARQQLGREGSSLHKARQANVDSLSAKLILETFLQQAE